VHGPNPIIRLDDRSATHLRSALPGRLVKSRVGSAPACRTAVARRCPIGGGVTDLATPAPKLSVVVCFFNMAREARRTLHSLMPGYQLGVDAKDYEVIAIDNGSTSPLDPVWIESLGPQFRHVRFDARSPSPCAAINNGVREARGVFVTCCIDGARILSPGILRQTLLAVRTYSHPFVYCLSMHLGPQCQNESITNGYDQAREDALLATVDWEVNGYALFKVSSPAPFTVTGFHSRLAESNCFSLRKADYLELGGFDERFVSPGGGLANLDFFNRVHVDERYAPVMLLGEATFHQLHGGVATNVPMSAHPYVRFASEYQEVKGRAFESVYRRPEYFGEVPPEALHLLHAPRE
jgi:glycosyltransferase involved in cell wall biosynthesis